MIKYKLGFFFLCFLYLLNPSYSQNNFDHSHSLWTEILTKHVTINKNSSTVNYKELKTDPNKLLTYNKSLSTVSKKMYESWNDNEKLAFLINAYNSFTLQLIIENYPVKSIKDIGGLFSNPWKKNFFSLLEEKTNLDHIEHKVIRKDFIEPRIHFALVCASKSCPALPSTPFQADKLIDQLNKATENFLSDKNKNRFNKEKNQLEISSIFKWYGGDFIKKHGSLENFLAPYFINPINLSDKIKTKKLSIKFLDYDWGLNE